jgi:branched-chain amino acid aminotransferase
MRLESRWSAEDLIEAAKELCRACELREDSYIRPFAYFGEGRSFNRVSAAHILINTHPFETRLGAGKVCSACVSSWTRISDNSMPARVKAVANYHNSRLASTEAQLNGYDNAILLTAGGHVAEGPGATLMLVRRGKLIVPCVTHDVLESITRATIMQIASEILHLPVEEREVDRTELYLADEAFYCGTGAEVMPIGSIDRYTIGTGELGPITRELDRIYHDMVRGIDQTYPTYATPVPAAQRTPVTADD